MKNDASFSKEFDALFEKITLRVFVSRKVKLLFAFGILLISSILVLQLIIVPKQLDNTLTKFNKDWAKFDAELDRIDEESPYKDTLPLKKEGIKSKYKPNYDTVKPYKIDVSESKIDFNNGYLLKINDPNAELVDNHGNDLKIKPEKSVTSKHPVPSVDQLATHKFNVINYQQDFDTETMKLTYFEDTSYYSDELGSIYISGNIIDNLNIQVEKDSDAFYAVFPKEKVGDTQTGLIIYAQPSETLLDDNKNVIPQTYVVLYKYWVFPDGVGVYTQQNHHFYGNLTMEKDNKNSDKNNLKTINTFTQLFDDKRSMLTWIDETYTMEIK